MSEAERVYAQIFAGVRAFFDQPWVKAAYEAEAKRKFERDQAERRAVEAERLAAEEERRRARAYDAYVLNGGSDECTRFGIMDGCKPWCPVFERGQCEIQEENEAAFAKAGAACRIRAWRVSPDNPRGEAQVVNLPDTPQFPDDAARYGVVNPKDMILVLVTDSAQRPERRNVLSTYIVRQKAARYVRDSYGNSVRETPLYPDLIGRVCVADGFAPITPVDVLADPVGADRTIVEGEALQRAGVSRGDAERMMR